MEVGANDDPYDDPWETKQDKHRRRTDKQLGRQLRNL